MLVVNFTTFFLLDVVVIDASWSRHEDDAGLAWCLEQWAWSSQEKDWVAVTV